MADRRNPNTSNLYNFGARAHRELGFPPLDSMLVIYDRAIKNFGKQNGGPKIAEETRIIVICITLEPMHIESPLANLY